ncbi:hypothetical protein RA25_02825 [Leisingera sp. ANG-S5]|nr:hypothetical protein RA25_02825 [Leisingera sp. ANG-S5]
MDDAKFGEVAPFFATLPEDFASGKVAEIANVGDLYIEHFIVLNSPELGNVYFRIIYEAGSDTMIGVKFDINTAAEKVLGSWPVLQEPVLQQC